MADCDIWQMLAPEWRPTPAPVSHLLAILGTADSFTTRYRLSTKNKQLLIWRQWPGWLILSFCDKPSLLQMSLVSKQFLDTVYSTLEKIASSRLHRLASGGVIKWIDEFAAFEQLKLHTASFGSSAYKEVDGSQMSSGDTLLLFRELQLSSKRETGPGRGLAKLAEFEWTKQGFEHFRKYLHDSVASDMSIQKTYVYALHAWNTILDVLTLNYQVLKIRAWGAGAVKRFIVKSVR